MMRYDRRNCSYCPFSPTCVVEAAIGSGPGTCAYKCEVCGQPWFIKIDDRAPQITLQYAGNTTWPEKYELGVLRECPECQLDRVRELNEVLSTTDRVKERVFVALYAGKDWTVIAHWDAMNPHLWVDRIMESGDGVEEGFYFVQNG